MTLTKYVCARSVAAALVLGTGATLSAVTVWPSDTMAAEACAEKATDLIAARTVDVGSVNVCNDAATLTVTYETTFPWCLLKTDLHIATIESDIPQNRNGHPQPGKFAYGDEHDCAGTATFEISLDQIDGGVSPGDSVVIAAHAEVDDGEREEGAWGDGSRFVERGNWATYFTYAVQEASCDRPGGSCIVFVTHATYTGNLGGLDGADRKCQDAAETAGLQGQFKAWLSVNDSLSPSTRFTLASVPYERVDGLPIARDWADLTDRRIAAPIKLDEEGHDVVLQTVNNITWTSTRSNGFAEPSVAGDCEDWMTSSHSSFAYYGNVEDVDERWTRATNSICGILAHLYCFQQ